MAEYVDEGVDPLAFGTPEKARRYETSRYNGAVGLNWYRCDPSLPRHCCAATWVTTSSAGPSRTWNGSVR